MSKNRSVILVTSSTGGCGRTMIAVALATYLTKHGTVAFIGDDIKGRGYFGEPELLPGSDYLHNPAEASWTGREAGNFPRHNLRVMEAPRDWEALKESLAKVEKQHDFVVVSISGNLNTSDQFHEFSNFTKKVDHTFLVYRQNQRSHQSTSFLREICHRPFVLPVVNFRSDSRETQLGATWSTAAIEAFKRTYAGVLNQIKHHHQLQHLDSADKLFYYTSSSAMPYLSYGSVNTVLTQSHTDPQLPAYAINNMAQLILATAREV